MNIRESVPAFEQNSENEDYSSEGTIVENTSQLYSPMPHFQSGFHYTPKPLSLPGFDYNNPYTTEEFAAKLLNLRRNYLTEKASRTIQKFLNPQVETKRSSMEEQRKLLQQQAEKVSQELVKQQTKSSSNTRKEKFNFRENDSNNRNYHSYGNSNNRNRSFPQSRPNSFHNTFPR